MTEQERIEALMKPRYKVVADYPGAEMPVGTIVTNIYELTWSDFKNYQFNESESWFKKYPHLFKRLEWWEDRDEKDMPGYLQCTYDDFIKFIKGQVIQVEKHQSNTYNQFIPWLFISKDKQGPHPNTNCIPYKNFLPATSTQFNQQLKEKK